MADLKQKLCEYAYEAGFDMCRLCRPWDVPDVPAQLDEFLTAGHHGQMTWLEARKSWRSNPHFLWPEAKSIIMLGQSYTPKHNPLDILQRPECGAISVYAQNKDYHDIVKKRLKQVARWLIEHAGGEVKVFVDTAPVPEKPLGQAAGLGWQGKHTNLVSRELGNWFFIGSVFTTLDIEPDSSEIDHCGSCRACLNACPTDAFPEPYKIDARRCISYLTIEHHGPVDPDLRPLLGNRIYGCDDCLAACPWNKFAQSARELRYHARDDLRSPLLGELAKLDDTAFRTRFSGSPIKRIGRNRFVRNVLYAIGNLGDEKLLNTVQTLTCDEDPTVRDAAQWALEKLQK